MAILFGLAVFAIIVAVGWRSVQNRRILRLQGADGQETIIIARGDDDISSITTHETVQAAPAPAPSVLVVNDGAVDPAPVAESGDDAASKAEANASGQDRLRRLVSSAK